MRTFWYVLAGFVGGILYMCGVLTVLERRTRKRLDREFSGTMGQ